MKGQGERMAISLVCFQKCSFVFFFFLLHIPSELQEILVTGDAVFEGLVS